MSVRFKSDPELISESKGCKIIKRTKDTLTIKDDGGPTAIFTFKGNCCFIESEWDYKEYFCKENNNVSQWCLSREFGGIWAMEYTQSLAASGRQHT